MPAPVVLTPSPPPSRPAVLWAVSCLLVALTALAYAPVRRLGFVPWDDQILITDEPHVRAGLTADGVRWALTSCDRGPWMPLSRLSYMADRQWFGLRPLPMHVQDVALHAAAAMMLFLFLVEATGGAVGRSGVTAALFAVHPMHVESVAWLSERRDVQCLALLTGSLWAYARYARRGGRVAYAAAVGLYAAAVVAKATAMTVPAILLLLDAWPLRRLPSRGDRAGWRRTLLEKVPFAAAAVPVAVVAAYGQRAGGETSSLAATPVSARVANALVTTVQYAEKLAVPRGLSAIYLAPIGGWPPGPVAAAATLIVVVALLAWMQRRRRPYLATGLGWFAVALLPVSGLAQAGRQSMADRYSYLPSIGLTVAAVWAAADLAGAIVPAPTARFRLAIVAAAAAVVTLAVACRTQVGYWRDGRTLFGHATDVTTDNWYADYNLGLAWAAEGDYRTAAAWLARGVEVNPRYPDLWDDLGNCVARTDPARAIALYESAIALDPAGARAHMNLGNALLAVGQRERATAAYARAVQLDPTSAYARQRLADVTARRP